MTTPDPPPGRTESRRGPLRPWIVITAVLFTLATVLALAWPAGGLKEAKAEIPHRRLNETTIGHRFSIKPYKVAYVTKDPAPSYGDAKPGRFLTVELVVTNVSRQTATTDDLTNNLYPTVSPGGMKLDRFKDRNLDFAIRDERPDRQQLQPGLTERVMIVYKLPAPVPDPTNLALGFEDEEYHSGFQSDLSEWYPGDPLAIYDLEVGR